MGPLACPGNPWPIELRSAQEGKSFRRRSAPGFEVLTLFLVLVIRRPPSLAAGFPGHMNSDAVGFFVSTQREWTRMGNTA